MRVKLILLLMVLFLGIIRYGTGAEGIDVTTPDALAVYVPKASSEAHSITLVWHKPGDYENMSSYNIYMDGKLIGNTLDGKSVNAATPYVKAFYADKDNHQAYQIAQHNYTVTGLEPGSRHEFTIAPVTITQQEESGYRIVANTLPEPACLVVTDYGAVGDGVSLNTTVLQQVIDQCQPGGKVLIPAGTFKTGPLRLKGQMTLELAQGACLLGAEDAALYAYEDKGELKFSSLLTLDGGSDIRIVGKGRIDGNGWQQSHEEEAADMLPVYYHANNTVKEGILDANHTLRIGILAKNSVQYALDSGLSFKAAYVRRPNLLAMKGVEGVYIKDVTFVNPANHALGFSGCTAVTLNSIKVETYDANNGDGVNFGSSDGLLVFNCLFNTGDDDINFSAGQGAKDQHKPSTKNIWIFNNYIRKGHGAVVAGSHTAAWIENILAEDNVIEHTDIGLRCKTTPNSGGGARNILFRDNVLKDIKKQAFLFTSIYSDPNASGSFAAAAAPGVFRNIVVKNCTVLGSGAAVIAVDGLPGGEHGDMNFDNIHCFGVIKPHINYMVHSKFSQIFFDQQQDASWDVANSRDIIIEGQSR